MEVNQRGRKKRLKKRGMTEARAVEVTGIPADPEPLVVEPLPTEVSTLAPLDISKLTGKEKWELLVPNGKRRGVLLRAAPAMKTSRSRKAKIAALATAMGLSKTDAAEVAGMSRTGMNLARKNPKFQEAVEQFRPVILREMQEQGVNLALTTGVMRGALQAEKISVKGERIEDHAIRMNAAKEVHKILGVYPATRIKVEKQQLSLEVQATLKELEGDVK